MPPKRVSLSTEDDHLLHGEAIALGMIGEIYLSTQLCGLPQDQAGEMVDWLCTDVSWTSLEVVCG